MPTEAFTLQTAPLPYALAVPGPQETVTAVRPFGGHEGLVGSAGWTASLANPLGFRPTVFSLKIVAVTLLAELDSFLSPVGTDTRLHVLRKTADPSATWLQVGYAGATSAGESRSRLALELGLGDYLIVVSRVSDVAGDFGLGLRDRTARVPAPLPLPAANVGAFSWSRMPLVWRTHGGQLDREVHDAIVGLQQDVRGLVDDLPVALNPATARIDLLRWLAFVAGVALRLIPVIPSACLRRLVPVNRLAIRWRGTHRSYRTLREAFYPTFAQYSLARGWRAFGDLERHATAAGWVVEVDPSLDIDQQTRTWRTWLDGYTPARFRLATAAYHCRVKLGLNWRGAYDATATYAADDGVFAGGRAYRCLIGPTTNIAPIDPLTASGTVDLSRWGAVTAGLWPAASLDGSAEPDFVTGMAHAGDVSIVQNGNVFVVADGGVSGDLASTLAAVAWSQPANLPTAFGTWSMPVKPWPTVQPVLGLVPDGDYRFNSPVLTEADGSFTRTSDDPLSNEPTLRWATLSPAEAP